MLEFAPPEVNEPAEREALFSLGGVTYEIPVRFPASSSLQYMDQLRKYGADVAVSWCLEHALDAAGYQALITAGEEIPLSGFNTIVAVVTARILGKTVVVPGPKAPTTPEKEAETTNVPVTASSPKPRSRSVKTKR